MEVVEGAEVTKVVNDLDRYLQEVRRSFPKGFSKRFYKVKENKDFKMMDEDTINDILSGFRQEVIRSQSEEIDLSYSGLVKTYGTPRKLMKNLLLENLPDEEFERFKERHFCLRVGIVACIVCLFVSLSVFSIFVSGSLVIQSNVTTDEVKTVIVEEGSPNFSVHGANFLSFLQFVKDIN